MLIRAVFFGSAAETRALLRFEFGVQVATGPDGRDHQPGRDQHRDGADGPPEVFGEQSDEQEQRQHADRCPAATVSTALAHGIPLTR